MKKLIALTITLAFCQFAVAQPPKDKKGSTVKTVAPPPDKPSTSGSGIILQAPASVNELPQSSNEGFEPANKSSVSHNGPIYTIVEQMPQFPGGEDSLISYIGKNIHYPTEAKDNNTQGTLYLTFVINEDGSTSDIRILRNIKGQGFVACANEAVRVVSSMPRWIPGKQNGKNIRVQYNLPVKFALR